MAFRILHAEHLESFEIRQAILNPAEAELHVLFRLTHPVQGAEIRGRLHGPRCAYASTIEIAYPPRPLLRQSHEAANTVLGRIIIPEPSLWDPVAPLLYEGKLELWAEGKMLAQVQVSHGLRTFQLGPRGLRWNGKPFLMHALRAAATDAAELRRLHDAGCNALVTPADDRAEAVCAAADRFGFVVLAEAVTPLPQERIAAISEHTCLLGWLIDTAEWRDATTIARLIDELTRRRQHAGLRLTAPGDWPRAAFVCCPEAARADPRLAGIPKLIELPTSHRGKSSAGQPPSADGILGYLYGAAG